MKESGHKFKYSSCDTSKIIGVQFGLMSNDEIERWAIDQLTNNEPENQNMTYTQGLCDLRLGISRKNEKCETCNQTDECPGHFGRIKLEAPIFHKGYIDIVIKVLKCICLKCAKLREPTDAMKLNKNYERIIQNANVLQKKKKDYEIQGRLKKQLNELSKILGKIKKCTVKNDINQTYRGCGSEQPHKIVFENYHLKITKQDKNIDVMSAEEVLKLFKQITPKDLKILGFFGKNSPADVILQNILVPPPQVRPSVEFNVAQPREHDDITKVYKEILKRNDELKKNITANDKNEAIQKITSIVARMMDNAKEREPALTVGQAKKKVKSIKERLKGKEGRFRQHLMGKRVDFSARSVVSPDAYLDLDQLGVPRSLALELSISEPVTNLNQKYIQKLCDRGDIKHILIPKEDKEEYFAYGVGSQQGEFRNRIEVGVIVERCLQNGDYVLFNRQPTLHKMSMMGHRVKILPYSTFRLNLSVTTPYNADFDGDEMNMHVPQSYESFSELKNICHVPQQIVTPKANKPVMGLVQDSLLGISLFTLRDTFLTKPQVMNLIMWIDNDNWEGELPMPAIIKPQPLWTGKQLISMIIPKRIQLYRPGEKQSDKDDLWNSFDDSTVLVQKGELLMGIMKKQIVGDGPGGLVHTIWLDLGPDETCKYLSQSQRIVGNWLTINGFTMSCSDIVPNPNVIKKMREKIDGATKKFDDAFELFHNEKQLQDQGKHKLGKKIFDSFEVEINTILNTTLKESEKEATKNVTFRFNNFRRMVWAGSKGKETNLAQVLGIVGQQNIEGARIVLGFNRRSLPHFTKDDHTISARGFVKNNFFSGLKPDEFFFHTMSGREGLSDTAVKTSRTGYIQRKLVKAIEDLQVSYDGTVRDCTQGILQFSYGEDGLSGEYVEKQGYLSKVMLMNDQKLQDEYRFYKQNENYKDILEQSILETLPDIYSQQDLSQHLLEKEFSEIKEARSTLKRIFMKPDQIQDVYLPVNIERIIKHIQTEQKIVLNKKKISLKPQDVYKKVLKFFDDLDDNFKLRHQEISLTLFKIHIRLCLASKKICIEHQFNEESLNLLISEIDTKFSKAQIHTGESVGAISAQSIGEPTTQMTLNTFHLAGVSERNVTLGVPRLQELLDASKKMKTPQIQVYFDPPLIYEKSNKKQEKNKKVADLDKIEKLKGFTERLNRVSHQLQQQKLKDLLIYTEIYFDPDPNNSIIPFEDKDENIFQDAQDSNFAPWVLILHSDKKKIINTMWDEIREAIQAQTPSCIQVTFALYGDENLWIKFRPDLSDLKELTGVKEDDQNLTMFEKMELLEHKITEKLDLGGIQGIKKVYYTKEKYQYMHLMEGEKDIGENKCKVERFIQTEGSNLRQILIQDEIDATRTFSNDVSEIALNLGIEAARKSLINEMKSVFKKYDIYVNFRHMCLLADWMTHRARFTPCNRNGINRIPNVSCLRKSSFEETVEIMYDACIFSELDKMNGVSENIMFGQRCSIGTGCFDLLVDKNQISNFKYKPGLISDDVDQEVMIDETEDSNGMSHTPVLINTPNPMHGGMTPGMSPGHFGGMFTPQYTPNRNSDMGFSPQHAFRLSSIHQPNSPYYQSSPYSPQNPQMQSTYSPKTGSGSPGMGMSNPSSPNYSPVQGQSPGSLQSPTYPNSNSVMSPSPTYSSSQAGKSSSPANTYYSSPHYYSPSSPNYQSSPQSSEHSNKLGYQSRLASSPSFRSSVEMYNTPNSNEDYQSEAYNQNVSSLREKQSLGSHQLQQVDEQEEYQSGSEDEDERNK